MAKPAAGGKLTAISSDSWSWQWQGLNRCPIRRPLHVKPSQQSCARVGQREELRQKYTPKSSLQHVFAHAPLVPFGACLAVFSTSPALQFLENFPATHGLLPTEVNHAKEDSWLRWASIFLLRLATARANRHSAFVSAAGTPGACAPRTLLATGRH